MRSLLYVYDVENLKSLKAEMKDFRFLSIACLIHICDTIDELELLDSENVNNSVIDITNIIKDDNYFRIFTERYFCTLSENFENVHFCLQSNYLSAFNDKFPHLFNNENVNIDFQKIESNDVVSNELKICNSLSLYTYKNFDIAKRLRKEGVLITLADLVEECEGIVFRYNINNITRTITEKDVQYLDISSIIRTLTLRGDLILQFEILLHHIAKIKVLKFTLENSLALEVNNIFPFTFTKESYLDDSDCEDKSGEENVKQINVDEVSSIADKINKTLKGHATFKSDFKHNLLKFTFLNKMGERKVLSILLCGDSGIGKTEFAKIASSIMFPDEQLIKINFGNYSTEGVLNSLIGSPLGYVGSEEGGELINKMNTSKAKVILIDEFERATASVFNFFYELLEDGIFTDRHGIEHNLNGYIIIFTSNMTQEQYQKYIPNSLKSRFDMVYYFIDLPVEDKIIYIENTAKSLINKLNNEFGIQINIEHIKLKLDDLVRYNNLRDIKRKLEDTVFGEFFKCFNNK